MDWDLLKLLLRLGIPASINMILVSLSEIAVIAFVNRYGSDATAAYGVVNQVASYVQMPAVSLGITVSILLHNQLVRINSSIAESCEGRNYYELRHRWCANISYLLVLKRHSITVLTSQTTIEIAHSLVMITLWSYLIFGHAQIISATMRASGTVLWPTVIGVVSIWLVEVPVAYYLSYHTSLGIEGIWIGYPAAFIVSLILQYAYYKLSWQKKRITRLVS